MVECMQGTRLEIGLEIRFGCLDFSLAFSLSHIHTHTHFLCVEGSGRCLEFNILLLADSKSPFGMESDAGCGASGSFRDR